MKPKRILSPRMFRALLITAALVASIQSYYVLSIRPFSGDRHSDQIPLPSQYSEAQEFRNGPTCPKINPTDEESLSHPRLVRIAMNLDSSYLRGTVAAVHSVLKHASCPENIFFHFIAASDNFSDTLLLTFPSLRFNIHVFDESRVGSLISSSVRRALENPLNYARSYLSEILGPHVKRVIYLDSDIILVDDVRKLWGITLSGSRVVGAPEYCSANFTGYFTDEFWSDPEFSRVFQGKTPCYFNTGVMVVDLERWREGDYTARIEKWMEVQKERRIYELGSQPPFMLVFGGDVEAIDRRWNQHGLGGDNLSGSCRELHPGPVSLLHWSGRGKPWVRLDGKRPCAVDYLWQPYDLYKPSHGDMIERL